MNNKEIMCIDLITNKIKDSYKLNNILIIDIGLKNILNLDNDIILKKNIFIKNISIVQLDEETDIHDIIIFYNLFSNNSKENVTKILEKTRTIIKNNGRIIFIHNLVTNYNQYYYHPFSYLRHYFFGKVLYISDFFDKIREYKLSIIDFDRIYSIDIMTYPVEYFSLITTFTS